MTPELRPAPAARVRPGIVRLMFATLAIASFALVTLALIRAGLFYFLYTSLLASVAATTGLDLWASRAVALTLCAVAWFLPWHVLLLPWIRGIRRHVALWIVVAVVTLASMEFVTRGVFFSREDGRPLKYYIRTLDGFRLSESAGIDPVYGVRYEPVTPDAAREYMLWKSRGGKMRDPALPEGQYFDFTSGQPVCWYARLPDGRMEMFTLPGFHPRYGTKLMPATPEVVAAYEKQLAEDRLRKQEEAARLQRQKALHEQRKARVEAFRQAAAERARRAREEELLQRPLETGRYVFAEPRPSGTIDGLRFTLAEVDLMANRTLVHVEVENVGLDPASQTPRPRCIRIGMVGADGAAIAYDKISAREGAVYDENGSMKFPAAGKRGAFVMQYPRLPDNPRFTFSVVVNDQPVLAGILLRKGSFCSF